MAANTRLKLPVMLSDCTDPYQPSEIECKITRKCVEALAEHGFPLLIVTKSDIVTRDIDVFKRTPTVVAITVTTPDESTAKLIEPFAPPPEKRISALQKIIEDGIIGVARIDPILPTVNDDERNFERLVSTLANIGVKQITVATMKPVKGFFTTLNQTDPKTCKQLTMEYLHGSWVTGYKYLPSEKRQKIVEKLRSIVLKHGLAFASCREGFPEYNTTFCDGTAYCRNLLNNHF